MRSPKAQLAVDLYEQLRSERKWTAEHAWQGIAELLLSCQRWAGGRWEKFHDVVVYRETNDFKLGRDGPNAVLERAARLTDYLAGSLSVPQNELCTYIGKYWQHSAVSSLQPHNLVGHAFRSLAVHILTAYGNPDIQYAEEVDAHEEFPGHSFTTRSRRPKIDIVARKENRTVALISSRWRFRHDRVDVVDEAIAYAPAARRQNPQCRLYAYIGEFAPNRIGKILDHCPPSHPQGALNACVHFAPQLIRSGLMENGRLNSLKSLHWLIDETSRWD